MRSSTFQSFKFDIFELNATLAASLTERSRRFDRRSTFDSNALVYMCLLYLLFYTHNSTVSATCHARRLNWRESRHSGPHGSDLLRMTDNDKSSGASHAHKIIILRSRVSNFGFKSCAVMSR